MYNGDTPRQASKQQLSVPNVGKGVKRTQESDRFSDWHNNRVKTRSVEPEPKRFWMAGAGAKNF